MLNAGRIFSAVACTIRIASVIIIASAAVSVIRFFLSQRRVGKVVPIMNVIRNATGQSCG